MGKKCSRCEVRKPVSAFSRRKAAKDGLQAWCSACMAEKARDRRAASPEAVRAYNASYRAERGDIARQATANWRARNPERVAEQKRKWARANRDAIRASEQRNAARRSASLKAWKAANRERVREYQRKRRAAGYGGVLGEVDGEALWAAQAGLCGLCGKPIDMTLAWPDPQSISLDHRKALSVGGLHETENCQWVHLLCNLKKGNRTNG